MRWLHARQGPQWATPAFDPSPVRCGIYAVGPTYTGSAEADVLAPAYTSSLARADEVGARAVAFPSLSTGAYGMPEREAARISLTALGTRTPRVESVLLDAFGRLSVELWQEELDRSRMGR